MVALDGDRDAARATTDSPDLAIRRLSVVTPMLRPIPWPRDRSTATGGEDRVRTIFALFADYAEAREAIEALRDRGFRVDAMNAIILTEAARSAMDVNLRTADAQASVGLSGRTLRGLDRLLATEQSVPLPPVGSVLAAGELANFIVAAAGASGSTNGGLVDALVDFGVPREAAEAYQRGVMEGGLLFWMRTDDERAGEAREIIQEHRATRVGAHP